MRYLSVKLLITISLSVSSVIEAGWCDSTARSSDYSSSWDRSNLGNSSGNYTGYTGFQWPSMVFPAPYPPFIQQGYYVPPQPGPGYFPPEREGEPTKKDRSSKKTGSSASRDEAIPKTICLNDLLPFRKRGRSRRAEAVSSINSRLTEEIKVDRDKLSRNFANLNDIKFFSFETLTEEIKEEIRNIEFVDLKGNSPKIAYVASRPKTGPAGRHLSLILENEESYFSIGIGLVLAKLGYEYKRHRDPLEIYHHTGDFNDSTTGGDTYLIEAGKQTYLVKNMVPSAEFHIHYRGILVNGKQSGASREETKKLCNELDARVKSGVDCERSVLIETITGVDLPTEIVRINIKIKDGNLYLGTKEQVDRALENEQKARMEIEARQFDPKF